MPRNPRASETPVPTLDLRVEVLGRREHAIVRIRQRDDVIGDNAIWPDRLMLRLRSQQSDELFIGQGNPGLYCHAETPEHYEFKALVAALDYDDIHSSPWRQLVDWIHEHIDEIETQPKDKKSGRSFKDAFLKFIWESTR